MRGVFRAVLRAIWQMAGPPLVNLGLLACLLAGMACAAVIVPVLVFAGICIWCSWGIPGRVLIVVIALALAAVARVAAAERDSAVRASVRAAHREMVAWHRKRRRMRAMRKDAAA